MYDPNAAFWTWNQPQSIEELLASETVISVKTLSVRADTAFLTMELSWSVTGGNMKWTGTKPSRVQAVWGEGISSREINGFNKLRDLHTLIVEDLEQVIDVSVLAKLTNLKSLSLSYSFDLVVDNTFNISFLENLTDLKYLQLSMKADNFSVLQNLTKLKYLKLHGTNIVDVSVLSNLTSLKFLDLSGTGVVDRSALANLTNLAIRY
jgi:hypothetical protein